jgi:hypothetical protein
MANARVCGDDIGHAYKLSDRGCRHAQSIRNELPIAAMCGCHTEATIRSSSVADIKQCTSATATADAKGK